MCLETERTCRQWIIHKGGGVLPTPLVYGVSPYTCAGDFPSVGRSIPPRCPISERTVPQNKAPLQGGVNESLPPLSKRQSSPAGYRVSR
mgnify:CR=1 FL=1